MRIGSLGLSELLLLALLFLLLWRGRNLSSLGRRLGEQARKPFRQARWVWGSVAGDEEQELRAEEAFGRECARELAAQFPGPVPPETERRVAEIGARLLDETGAKRHFAFRSVAAPGPNAFALPGGFVFVTDAMSGLCGDDRDALAFVVAHEMGHVLRHHVRDRLMADLAFGFVGRRLPAAGRVVGELLGKGYSREQEREADREAVRMTAEAGFDPEGGVRALGALAARAREPDGPAEYFSSHPRLDERIRSLEEILAARAAGAAAR